MSIAQKSLLRLIVEEVANASQPAAVAVHEHFAGADESLEVATTRHVHAAPFATSMHFWAHALRGFLERSDRPELFVALATNCRCEAAGALQPVNEWSPLAERFGAKPLTEYAGGPLERGFAMIAEASLVSWVAETANGYVAWFWARSEWLAVARPVVIE